MLKKESTKQLIPDGKIDPRMLIPIIIFQSGKVGSTTVHVSLLEYKNISLATPIFHAHVLERIDPRIDLVRATRANPENSIRKSLERKICEKTLISTQSGHGT